MRKTNVFWVVSYIVWVSTRPRDDVVSGSAIHFGIQGHFEVISRSNLKNYTPAMLWVSTRLQDDVV